MTAPLPKEIPLHETFVFAPKKTKYCLIVPVINEGEKIIKQLKAMKQQGVSDTLDIIIADGGSTDGSLAEDFLKDCGVRTLLVKTDKGKLSAQLRMGFSYALDEGYEGIVVIDGNGKDSIESIPLFIDALDQGIDYAQASRFIPGGKGIRTPLSRTLAIKLLHAPLLSLAAGKRFTDTTQGYRAYSHRYLEDPRVQPFRSIFETYELLAYLTVRASQLGYNVTEIPTTRTYPAQGKIPTKITLSGIFDLIFILLKTVFRCYHPRKSHE